MAAAGERIFAAKQGRSKYDKGLKTFFSLPEKRKSVAFETLPQQPTKIFANPS